MNRLNITARWLLQFTVIAILSGCGTREPAADSSNAQDGDQGVQKQTTASLSKRSKESIIYVAVTAEDSASISLSKECSTIMGSGGNFTEGSYTLKGKCNGGGLSPRIMHGPEENHFLSFTVDPEQSVPGTRDRAELALVRRYFPFNEQLFIGFRLMIPEDMDVTEEFFYALQLWQCAGLPPIAGVRVQRGASHSINFMTRNEKDGRSRAKFDLNPGQWHAFVLQMIPSPSDDALFLIFADGELLAQSHVPYGFGAADACGEMRNELRYRVKFGIYKGGEPGKRFSVNYDDFTIADRYESVAVPLGWDPVPVSSGQSKVTN